MCDRSIGKRIIIIGREGIRQQGSLHHLDT